MVMSGCAQCDMTACGSGENALEAEATTVDAIVKHYQAVQQSNAPLQPSNTATKDKRTDSTEKYYSSGTPAERYWTSMGAENSKRQNVSSLLQMIFPDGLAPLANKVAKIERKEQAKADRQAARQASALAAVSHAEADAEATEAADNASDLATDHVTGIITRNSGVVIPSTGHVGGRFSIGSGDFSGLVGRTRSVMPGSRSPNPPAESVCASDAQARDAGPASGSNADGYRRTTDAASAIFATANKPHHRHYSHGQKLAASILWEAASGKSQPVKLRQCLTYSEIRMKNFASAELAQLPFARLELQEPAF